MYNTMQIADFLNQEHAKDIQIFNKPNNWCEHGIIASATSSRHISMLCSKIKTEYNITYKEIHGDIESGFIVVELKDIILLIFTEEKREFYDIETLWEQTNEL